MSAVDSNPVVVPNYGREGTRGPLAPDGRRVVVERFPDGGVTVWTRVESRRGSFKFSALVIVVLLSVLAAALTNGKPWRLPSVLAGFGWPGRIGIGLIVSVWLGGLFGVWRRERRGERSWDVVGIGPETVYADGEPRKGVPGRTFEAPRNQRRDVRLTTWGPPEHWARSVEVVVSGHEPVEVCTGFNEGEIQDAYEAMKSCLDRLTNPPGG